jgi:hypothetical protein
MTKLSVRNYMLAFVKPERGLRNIIQQPGARKFALICVSSTAALYTLMYVFLTVADASPSVFTPWLNISKENYYYYNQFLVAPSLFLCWIVASGFIQSMSYAFNGRGAFKNTLSLTGVSISIAMWPTLVHDLSTSFLSAIYVMDAQEHELAMNTPTVWRTLLWICVSIYLALFLILFTKTVKVTQKIGSTQSALIGVSAFIVFQIVFLIFNR